MLSLKNLVYILRVQLVSIQMGHTAHAWWPHVACVSCIRWPRPWQQTAHFIRDVWLVLRNVHVSVLLVFLKYWWNLTDWISQQEPRFREGGGEAPLFSKLLWRQRLRSPHLPYNRSVRRGSGPHFIKENIEIQGGKDLPRSHNGGRDSGLAPNPGPFTLLCFCSGIPG